MKKIPTLFVRQRDGFYHWVTPEVTPGCEWVLAGEGTATRKYDGTCVRFHGGAWWGRREVKPGKEPPPGWVEADHDETTGKRTGWESATGDYPFKKPLRAAIDETFPFGADIPERTYELCGPKINGNPEDFDLHELIPHGEAGVLVPVLSFDGLRDLLTDPGWTWEGIVWHHPDGRMAKLKRRDFPTPEGGQ